MAIGKYKNLGRIAHASYERLINAPLPKTIAKIIAYANEAEYKKLGTPRMVLKTYDGSNQAVHPDFIYWKNKTWLVCTPYPYGYNKCENPSVFVGESLTALSPACKNPIDYPSSKTRGSILSDPCFFENDSKLFICYRERIQSKETVTYNLYAKSSADGSNWSNKVTIQSTQTADNDPLISPAIINYDGTNYLYHVRAKGLGGDIVLSALDEQLKTKEIKTLACKGLPEGFLIWHIGLHSSRYTKDAGKTDKILGLFTVRNGKESRVYAAFQESPEQDWIIDKEICVPNSMKENCRELYKCSYTPDGKIALSFFDEKNRLALVII